MLVPCFAEQLLWSTEIAVECTNDELGARSSPRAPRVTRPWTEREPSMSRPSQAEPSGVELEALHALAADQSRGLRRRAALMDEA